MIRVSYAESNGSFCVPFRCVKPEIMLEIETPDDDIGAVQRAPFDGCQPDRV